MAVYDYAGAQIELPDEASPQQVMDALAAFRKTPDFMALVDQSTGAPSAVRAIVGSAPEQDRLANLQRYFPDAMPHGDENFIFTNPETQKPTLYNPKGLDMGDAASLTRDATMMAGSAVGAIAGAAGGFITGAGDSPMSPAGGLIGGIAGAGLGNAAGASLFDAVMSLTAGRIDTRPAGQRAVESVLDVAFGSAGQALGPVVAQGVAGAVKAISPQAQSLVGAYQRLGIQPTTAAVGGRGWKTTAAALDNSPFSAGIMEEEAVRVIDATRQATEGIIAQIGTPLTQQGAGQVIRDGVTASVGRFEARQAQLYEEAFNKIGPDTLADMGPLVALRQEIEAELAAAPSTLGRTLGPALTLLQEIEKDAVAAGGGVPFAALRQIRTAVGKDLASPVLAGSSGAQNAAMSRVYGALTESMSATAQTAGADAAKSLAVADRYTRQFMRTSADTMNKIAKMNADEQAFGYALSQVDMGGTLLSRLRRHFQPEEWDLISASVLHRMGLATKSNQNAAGDAFSASTFLTTWNKLSPEAKKVLFGGQRYQALATQLDDLTAVIGSLKSAEKLANHSNTSRSMVTLGALGALGTSALGFAVGVPWAGEALATAGGLAISSRTAAKLMTSPAFVKWLTTAPSEISQVPAFYGRLAGVAADDPDIAEAVYEYANVLFNRNGGGQQQQQQAQ